MTNRVDWPEECSPNSGDDLCGRFCSRQKEMNVGCAMNELFKWQNDRRQEIQHVAHDRLKTGHLSGRLDNGSHWLR